MNESIIRFIEKQKCAAVCCVDENGKPCCFSCFYAFNSEEGLLYFKSSADSFHMKLLMQRPFAAGTILPDKLQVLVVKGIQFQGSLLPGHHALSQDASKRYHGKYPFALTIPGEVWTIQLSRIKMTDGSKGFGKKASWARNEGPVE